ncbi:MAG: hypothetical protein OXB99_13115 [Acidimicrobiaceae bacterium]|nr:hypothetical protein [Acidimicrobiaceae bacterium]
MRERAAAATAGQSVQRHAELAGWVQHHEPADAARFATKAAFVIGVS